MYYSAENEFKAFLYAAEEKSFTKTAKRMHFSQSRISKMIKDLEETFGFPLFVRKSKEVILTSEGRSLIPYMKRVLNSVDSLDHYVDTLKNLETGTLTIGSFSSVASNYLPSRLTSFQKEYPHINIEVKLGDYPEIKNWIKEGSIDFGFLPLPQEGLESEALFEDPLMAVVPLSSPLAKKKSVSLKDFSPYPFFCLEQDGSTLIASLFQKENIALNCKFKTWEDYAILALVEQGQGNAILPSLVLERNPYNVKVLPIEEKPARTIGIVYQSKELLSLTAKAFFPYLKEEN